MAGIPFALLLSDTAGETWRNVRRRESGFGRMVAFAPDFSETGVVFVATTFPSDPSWRGFLRSTDAGASWTPVGPEEVYEVAFSPHWDRDGGAWAATPRGLFVTRDRGETWQAERSCPASRVNDISATAGTDGAIRLLVCAPGLRAGGVFRSEDGGASWNESSAGIEGHRVVHVAFAAAPVSSIGFATWTIG